MQTPPSATEPLPVSIGKLSVEQGRLSYRDSRKQSSPGWVPPSPLPTSVCRCPVSLQRRGRPHPYRLRATLSEEEPLKAEGELDP